MVNDLSEYSSQTGTYLSEKFEEAKRINEDEKKKKEITSEDV